MAVSASYASGIAFALLLLSSLTWIFYGNGPSSPLLFQCLTNPLYTARYAGPIKTTTRWTAGAEIELPPSSTFKSVTVADETTSAAHGRSAHVFSTFPTLMSNAPPEESVEWDSSGSGFEGSRGSTMEHEERRRWGVGMEEEEGVRGRARSANGREGEQV
mgnify:CR=1 FL=1